MCSRNRISLLSLHAGALEFRTDAPSEEVARAAAIIRQNAHQALQDLRRVIWVLRESSAVDSPPPPQPTLADLPTLIEDSRQAGVRVRLDDRLVDLGAVPAAVGRDGYRIVQEALTNARKHAPGCAVEAICEWCVRLRSDHRSAQPDASRRPPGGGNTRHRNGHRGADREGHACQRPAGARPDRRRRLSPVGVAALDRMTARIRVLIVDDDPLVRAGLSMLLTGSEDIHIVGEAANGTEAAANVDALGPDVVLMDIRMPGMDGLATTELLRKRSAARRSSCSRPSTSMTTWFMR
jgi:Response regulator receiver domain/Histidine kinase